MSGGFDVSVLICTRDRPDSLAAVLPTLEQQALAAGLTAELVVVDNGVAASAAGVVRGRHAMGAPVRWVAAPEPGLSRARNVGMDAARGRVLVFTDDDVRVPEGWVAAMAEPILAGRVDAVAGSVRLAGHLERPWMEPFHRATLAGTDLLRPADPGVMMGASMAFGAHVRTRVRHFDERLGAGALGTAEETLFSWQLEDAGYRIGRVAEPVVEHHCEPARLSRAAYRDAAVKLGRSYGYIGYHWLHTTHLGLDAQSAPRLLATSLAQRLRILRWRLRRAGRPMLEEGITHAEFYLLLRLAYIEQFRRERRGPRRYSPRARGARAAGAHGAGSALQPAGAEGG